MLEQQQVSSGKEREEARITDTLSLHSLAFISGSFGALITLAHALKEPDMQFRDSDCYLLEEYLRTRLGERKGLKWLNVTARDIVFFLD